MSSLSSDVAQARAAARTLSEAVERLTRSHASTVDLRRLAEDVRRINVDLDLLDGPDPAASSIAGRHDLEYDPRQFGDGAYEGMSPRRR